MGDDASIEVHVELDGATCRVGTLRRHAARGGEPPSAIERMASAFEHSDLDAALATVR